jgi:hypothetical protein
LRFNERRKFTIPAEALSSSVIPAKAGAKIFLIMPALDAGIFFRPQRRWPCRARP